MALTQNQAEIRANVRKFANVQGTTALLRHPNADINDYINRALGSLHRRLTTAIPDQRFLATTTITTSAGVSTEPLPSDFDSLITAELIADGRRVWLVGFEMHEQAGLLRTDVARTGVPFTYRLRAGNIEILPVPQSDYSVVLWYLPTTDQLANDAATFDTISRLDDYVVAYAARLVAIKGKDWDLRDACSQVMGELESEIDVLARTRDRNSPPRIVDIYQADRWGRQRRCR